MPPDTATPERSIAQRRQALDRANEVRRQRAQLKRELKAGRAFIHEQLSAPPDYALTAKVCDLLIAVPKIGRVKVNKMLVQARVSPSKTLGGLSARQRQELAGLLRRMPVPRRPPRPLDEQHRGLPDWRDEARALRDDGLTLEQIARRLGRSLSGVSYELGRSVRAA